LLQEVAITKMLKSKVMVLTYFIYKFIYQANLKIAANT
jgi:hypothetical protein